MQNSANSDSDIVKFLSRHRRESDMTSLLSSGLLFGVRLEIPIRLDMINDPKAISSNNNDKLNVIDIIENEALFNKLFNLEQVFVTFDFNLLI